MAKQLVKVKKSELDNILQTQAVCAYFYWDYWEFCGAHFDYLKTYPAGTLTADMLEAEINKLYEHNYNLFDEYENRLGYSATLLIYIGYFDDVERDFHIIAWKGKEE